MSKKQNYSKKHLVYCLGDLMSDNHTAHSVPTAQKRFINDCPNTSYDWKAIYELPLKVTVDLRTRQFRPKLLHRTLYLIRHYS